MKVTRHVSREMAFILLFEYLVKGDETAEEIWENSVEYPELKKSPYAVDLFFGCVNSAKEIDALIDRSLVGWRRERVSFVSRATLMIAVFEMMNFEDVPYKVAIDEAITLSKKFEGGNAYTFVNGVLNAVAESLSLK